MEYEKPEIVLSVDALRIVQGAGKIDDPVDSDQPTNAAYEADE